MAIATSVEPASDTVLPHHIIESCLTPARAPTTKLFSLAGRSVVVTGAGRGLGITLATAVLEAGGDAICLDILPEPSKEDWANIVRIQKSSKASAIYLQCNVVDESAVSSSLAQAAEYAQTRGKPIRGLLHCAGIQQMIDAMEYPLEGFRRILDVNVTGSFLLAKHTARLMRDEGNSGSLVLIASMSGQIANRGIHCSAYNSSKAAVQQMCRSLAMEFGVHGIRVNSLSPGYIRTAMTDQLLEEKPEIEKLWMMGAHLGRLGAPEDFKAPAVFLLADGSAFMTGSDLRVDGGHCASA
ncbi:uncharacterized protein A1O9_02242 [Exophiala aquamarina CBS 119918]|uniref:Gluconate 5-dehydrogenase n=1 Tax=Exophiala aquamarina CBS 119918 TaxID=1182545 RepID=A0A072PLC7_9EURO|nr:uncharacterized protein A1O9_02242 [Exophiala aquamarina CBS 119918]KEF60681.1 hypothetical protein A1O9_02242 [Exophiala aquamarina CBS 119918]